ncbi:glycoside hydrolase family 13 protein [Bacillus sonorensis]|uniref:glycoside hydrolase family 13 protein n=1 Tax=Bacillus sonorensis TaxID=119858 RepID=UPI000495929C|nr:glycoside hydrolase family 13 protein [Bacillus sonorensis]MCY8024646.1 glycoside hydrolase family 13 protein [Bacillus sonorensis]MCY8088946.1 glycoside hydrolase family 13 protein [Bacillus sonorensis]MCY8403837.1 glycoside hydrolase family 13 protein [Bacillus sonorensis]MCZ0070718.1 glycoside hydrolase family 13 protein [Bacillus sonorensis]MCZ0098205.1 glycoside hydrolase family 13 protein [Bacillus sonorensis]
MEYAAIHHQPFSSYAYSYDGRTVHIKIRTKKGDADQVRLMWGDPYAYTIESANEAQMKKIASTEVHDYWFAEVTPPYRRLQYAFVLTDRDHEDRFYGSSGVCPYHAKTLGPINDYFKFPFVHDIDTFQAPEWVKSTIWYQIFPERFANGREDLSPEGVLPWGSKEPDVNDFFGGDLQGIIDKLDYLEELGVNGIYLTPIFSAPSNHKYDTLDYYSIDQHFGDPALFRTLVDQLHRRGMRIMLDAVFNHIGSASPQWQDVLENGEQSRYKDWFHIHSFPVKEGGYDTFAFTSDMPKLNTANPEVQTYLLDIALYWIREFDIDGWRLDVANEVDHAFWKTFRQAVLNEKPDLYILGEIWHNAEPWLRGDEFHGVMNYPFTAPMIDYFADSGISASQLAHRVNAHLMNGMQQANEAMFNLLDSHDTQRILTRCGHDEKKVRSLLAFMFAQTGSPCIYYGTEIGLDGGNDPLCRKCMVWEEDKQNQKMLKFMKRLIALRKHENALLTYGSLEWNLLDDRNDFISFSRAAGDKQLIYFFNQGSAPRRVSLQDLKIDSSTKVYDAWTEQTLDHADVIDVNPGEFFVLGAAAAL